MPLIALNKNTGERIDITKIREPRADLQDKDLICPFCQQPMGVIAGLIKMPHFRHDFRCTDTLRHPESMHHINGKDLIAKLLRESYPTADVQLEVHLPQIGRIADVIIELEGGWKEVYEIQLASITTEELESRSKSYLSAGISITWVLGLKAATETNKTWVTNNFGRCNVIDFNDESDPTPY